MITKKELTGAVIKKALSAHRAAQRWHNKNKQGGNFGFNIYFAQDFNRDTDKEITGYYDKNGNIWSLTFGPLYSAGHQVPIWALENTELLFTYLHTEINGGGNTVRKSELLTKKEQLRLIGFEV